MKNTDKMRPTQTDIKKVALKEEVSIESLAKDVKNGETIIVTSKRGIEPVGIGKGLRAKFACIVGTSTYKTDIEAVIRKAKIAVQYGASVIHNGSIGGNVREIQRRLLEIVNMPLAVCHPIGITAEACYEKRRFVDLKEREFIEQVRRDVEAGVEILLLPVGVTESLVDKLPNTNRIMPCCSKSGSIMAAWIAYNKKENPYCVHFDEILKIAKEHNTTLSIVGAFRSGCIHDALDKMQYEELKIIKEYVDRARSAGVQIKAGSGGHLPADKIAPFFHYQKEFLKVPIISFGPQVTDVSLGHDHISAAMGQLIALLSGADIIFSITPSEHITLPDEEQTKQGCITAKIVCHSADIAKGKDLHMDNAVSKSRESMDWEEQIKFVSDESVAEKLKSVNVFQKGCDICGNFCAYELMNLYLKNNYRKRDPG